MIDKIGAGEKKTEELLHYGVKGMKWGVRRKRTASRVTLSTNRRGGIKARGGENRKPSADAKKAAVIGRVGKKSGYQALTNAQLRAYTERKLLEKNARKHDMRKIELGVKITEDILKAGYKVAKKAI